VERPPAEAPRRAADSQPPVAALLQRERAQPAPEQQGRERPAAAPRPGVLRPGVLRPGVLRPGVLRPGALRPRAEPARVQRVPARPALAAARLELAGRHLHQVPARPAVRSATRRRRVERAAAVAPGWLLPTYTRFRGATAPIATTA